MITILFLSLFPFFTSQCSSCVELNYHQCWVCYENCQNGVIFHNCTIQECESYSDDSDGNKYCVLHVNVSLPQQDCFSKCCGADMSQTSYFSVQALDECEQYNNSSSAITIAIASSVFGFCCLIFYCCICIHHIFDNETSCSAQCSSSFTKLCQILKFLICCQCFRRENRIENYEQKNPQNNQTNENSKYQWKRDNAASSQIQESSNLCTICLMNKVNTLTNCGHFYHLKCILEWFHRNPTCPLCIKNDYNPVKFYCCSCFTFYNTFDINSRSKYTKIMGKIKGPKCPPCE